MDLRLSSEIANIFMENLPSKYILVEKLCTNLLATGVNVFIKNLKKIFVNYI